jgi:hypothetical protein
MMATAHVQADGSEIGSILQVVSSSGKTMRSGAMQVASVHHQELMPICFRHGMVTVTRQADNIVHNGDLTVWEEVIQQVREKRFGLVYLGRVWSRHVAIGATRMHNRHLHAQCKRIQTLQVEKVRKQTKSVC